MFISLSLSIHFYPFLGSLQTSSNPRFPDVSCILGSLPSPQNQSGPTASGHEIQGGETGKKIGWLGGWTWLDGPKKKIGIDISSPSPWICHAQAQWNDHRLILYTWWTCSEDHYWTDDTKQSSESVSAGPCEVNKQYRGARSYGTISQEERHDTISQGWILTVGHWLLDVIG